ncbi:MAG TPA: carbohydrate ABC transporter permease [Aggregatilineales bacterium]|nr:carbohydrate ABC transporter permease [Aggregatilineales bacterium]
MNAYDSSVRRMMITASVTLFALMLVAAFLLPFAYGTITAFKNKEQIVTSARGSILPVSPVKFTYNEQLYDVFEVPMPDGEVRTLALIRAGRNDSTFVDPANPEAGEIFWEGRWRTLQQEMTLDPQFGNFQQVWNGINFPILLRNTGVIALVGTIGTLLSCILVAYGFARFPIPGKSILFMLLIGTIILPRQVTLVPTYAFFSLIGWTGTWLPLIVPHFFANAYNVFLLRQYFMTLPRELDEAAVIDGAGPFRVLLWVIIPQSWPVIVTVSLFHIVFAWNDYFEPLIYLLGRPDLQPISVGIQRFNFIYDQQPHLIQATALLGLAVPVLLFFLAQRFFMRGVVITGVEK